MMVMLSHRRAEEVPTHAEIRIRYAARTDHARDGSNTTYFSIVEDDAFFIVADAPRPEDSLAYAAFMTELVTMQCRTTTNAAMLKRVIAQANARFGRERRSISFAAALIRGTSALVASEGSAPIFVRRGARFDRFDSPRVEWIDLHRGDTILLVDQPSADAIDIVRLCRATPDTCVDTGTLERLVVQLQTDSAPLRAHHAISTIAIHVASR